MNQALSAAQKDLLMLSIKNCRKSFKMGSKGGIVGQWSPNLDVEPYLIKLIKKLSEMRTPNTTVHGLLNPSLKIVVEW